MASRGDVLVAKRSLGFGSGSEQERYAVVQSDALNSVLDVTLVVPVEVATKANSGTPLAVPVTGAEAGTDMAFILGIYERLLAAIRSFDKRWLLAIVSLDFKTVISRPHWLFLIPLLGGILGALVFFTRVVSIPEMLTTHTEQIYGLLTNIARRTQTTSGYLLACQTHPIPLPTIVLCKN